MKRFFILTLLVAFPVLSSAKDEQARLLRFPSIGGDQISFTYSGDLYSVSVNGGVAVKMTSDIGFEMFSRYSPDGKTIAFTAQYDGNTEVYTIPAEGGVPKRITYTATLDRDNIGDRMGPNNIVMCWTPDGKSVVFRTRWYTFSGLRGLLYKVPVDGGNLEQIPTTEGGFCSYSPDGKYLALNRMFREFRTWKYYRGGQADDIWINKVGTTQLENITMNDAQDIFPMWVGEDIYFLSDRDNIMNLFSYNVKSKQTVKITNFTEYDCKFPSFSKDYIVFENGGYIYKYSIKTKECLRVNITINDELLFARGKNISASEGWYSFSLSPDGERVLTTVRGDIFSLPASVGATYNLSSSAGSHEREAEWSPDGNSIAYISDISGEYQIYVTPSNNSSQKSVLTNFKDGYPSDLSWSPNSKELYFTTEKNDMYSLNVSTKKLKKIFQGESEGAWDYTISKDGNWIAYVTLAKNKTQIVNIYDVINDKHHTVTSEWYNSYSPIFSDDGKYLFFTSERDFIPIYSSVEWNASYSVDSYVFVLPLNSSVKSPLTIIGDQYKPKEEKVEKVEKKESTGMTIDFGSIIERSVALPLGSGRYQLLAAYDDLLYFRKGGETKSISMKNLEVKDVTKEIIFAYTPDFKKAVIGQKDKYYVVSTSSFKADKPIPLSDASVYVDYHKEWKQIFEETWRVYRDHFYVKNMVGKDWNKIKDKYEALLPYVNHRQDLTYIIGEMIAELATGHCYVTTGEAPEAERVKVGLLGAKFSKDKSGFFKIDKIFKGVSWGEDMRSPLGEIDLGVKEGDYILSINGIPSSEYLSVFEPLVGKVGVVTALEINGSPSTKGSRTIYVKPIADETKLAYYEWVQNNIRKVNEASNGEIGYIHIPDMDLAGLEEFTKLFYTQLNKKGLIIDDRMNGGGNVSPMITERLQRVVYRINMYRNGGIDPVPVPNQTHYGPKVCLVDKYSSSDGDLFPYGFQKLGIGKVIGVRTWGGIVGISGSKPYLDGQDVRTPFFTSYSTDGKWIVENRGVDPDIIVDINPFEDYLGTDAQLNKAIEVIKAELKDYKPLPSVPKDPVR